jgi:leader peptidase (prepilin peptidase)/N-methyltransferase
MRFALTGLTIPYIATGAIVGAAVAGASRLLERSMRLPMTRRRLLPLEIILPAVLFAAIGAQFGPTHEAYIRWFWIALLTQVLFFDLRHRLILDAVVLPGIVAALALSPVGQQTDLISSVIGGAAAGLAFLAILIAASRRYGGDVMGFGDVKLAGFIGAMLGIQVPGVNAVRAIVLGLVLGSAAVLLLMLLGRLSRRDTVPLGPFLCAGALAILLLPPDMLWPFG